MEKSLKLIEWNPKSRPDKEIIKLHGKTWEILGESEREYFVQSLCYSFNSAGKLEKFKKNLNREECQRV